MINAEVSKSGSEAALSTIRKFSRRVQGTGLIRIVRNARYFARGTSKTVRKKRALKLLKRRADYMQQLKEGKITESPAHRTRRSGQGEQQRQSQSRAQEGIPTHR